MNKEEIFKNIIFDFKMGDNGNDFRDDLKKITKQAISLTEKEMKKEINKIISKFEKVLEEYHEPSSYYNNKTNKEYWKGAKRGWKDCVFYLEMELNSIEEVENKNE